MSNALDQKLQSYFVQLNEAEKKIGTVDVKNFLAGRMKADERISVEQYNKKLDKALAEAEAGNYITQEAMEEQAKKW